MKTEQFTREELNSMDKEQLVEAVLAAQLKNDLLTGELNHTKAMLFGRRSEKVSTESENEQLMFEFNEAERYASEPEAEEVKEVTIGGHTRRIKVKGKKDLDLSKLPKRVEPPCMISDDKLKEIFPEGWKELPDEIHKHVEYEPATRKAGRNCRMRSTSMSSTSLRNTYMLSRLSKCMQASAATGS